MKKPGKSNKNSGKDQKQKNLNPAFKQTAKVQKMIKPIARGR
jgi:hypothetical protein